MTAERQGSNCEALPGPEPRRPIQFTMRTFFVAAVLISLFAAAAKLPGIEVRITALVFLSWLTMVGVYWICRARTALVALGIGPVALWVGWLLSIPVYHTPGRPNLLWMSLPAALGWAGFLSIFISVLRGLGALGTRLVARRQRIGQGTLSRRVSSARELAVGMTVVRLWLSGLLFAASLMVPPSYFEAPLILNLAADLPLALFVVGVVFPNPPETPYGFFAVTTLFSLPLYFGLGWVIGLILDRFRRSRLPAATTDTLEPAVAVQRPERGENGEPWGNAPSP